MYPTYLPMTDRMCGDFAALAAALAEQDRPRADAVAASLLEHCEWDRFVIARGHFEAMLAVHFAMPAGWVLAAGDGQHLVNEDNVLFVLRPARWSQARVELLGALPAGLHDLAEVLPMHVVRRRSERQARPGTASTA